MIHWDYIANRFRLRCLIDDIIKENAISSQQNDIMEIAGKIMRKTRGTENPVVVIELLREKLKKDI